jgi:hypothetical protein
MQDGRRWAVWVGVLGILGALLSGMWASAAPGARAQTGAGDTAQCSVATLHGTYLFAGEGVQVTGRDQIPFAAAGYEVYHGNGTVDVVFSVSQNGKITRNLRFSGS